MKSYTVSDFETIFDEINPYRHEGYLVRNKIINIFQIRFINKKIAVLNNYLRDVYRDKDITTFTYACLLKIFYFETILNVENVVDMACQHVLPHGVVLDIGGNIGKFTRKFLERHNRSVVLFEPVPLYRDYCRILFAANQNVRVVGSAASDEDGSAVICIDSINLGWNTLVVEKKTQRMIEYECETIRLDSFFSGEDKPDIGFIKIDVEGAEFKVLSGFRKTLAALDSKPPISVEVGWGAEHPYYEKQVAEFKWLMAHGWQPFQYVFEGTRDVLILPAVTLEKCKK